MSQFKDLIRLLAGKDFNPASSGVVRHESNLPVRRSDNSPQQCDDEELFEIVEHRRSVSFRNGRRRVEQSSTRIVIWFD